MQYRRTAVIQEKFLPFRPERTGNHRTEKPHSRDESQKEDRFADIVGNQMLVLDELMRPHFTVEALNIFITKKTQSIQNIVSDNRAGNAYCDRSSQIKASSFCQKADQKQ